MVKVQGFDLPISKRQLLKNILLVTKVKTLKQSFKRLKGAIWDPTPYGGTIRWDPEEEVYDLIWGFSFDMAPTKRKPYTIRMQNLEEFVFLSRQELQHYF